MTRTSPPRPFRLLQVRIVGYAALLLLAACAPLGALQDEADAASRQADAVCAAADGDPRLFAVSSVMGLGTAPTPEQLSNQTHANATQQRALAAMDQVYAECHSLKTAYYDHYAGARIAAAYRTMLAHRDAQLSLLQQGLTPFGTYNAASRRLTSGFARQVAQFNDEQAARDALQQAAPSTDSDDPGVARME